MTTEAPVHTRAKDSRAKKRHDRCACGKIKLISSTTCRSCRWRQNPDYHCPSCGERKTKRAAVCNSCRIRQAPDAKTMKIVAELAKLPFRQGSQQKIANRYGLSRSRVSAIVARHKPWGDRRKTWDYYFGERFGRPYDPDVGTTQGAKTSGT